MSQWYAVSVAPRRERAAIASLDEQGFATFMPCEKVNRPIRREVVEIHRPLFPGYVFVLCDPRHFREVREIDTVRNFVCYLDAGAMTPVAFPFAAILEMQADERAGRYDRTRAKPKVYQPRKGDRVQVTAGPWAMFVGKVIDTPRSRRAHVMLDMPFGQGKRRGVTLHVDRLKAA